MWFNPIEGTRWILGDLASPLCFSVRTRTFRQFHHLPTRGFRWRDRQEREHLGFSSRNQPQCLSVKQLIQPPSRVWFLVAPKAISPVMKLIQWNILLSFLPPSHSPDTQHPDPRIASKTLKLFLPSSLKAPEVIRASSMVRAGCERKWKY